MLLETNAREMEEHSESECSLLLLPRSMVVLCSALLALALLFSPLVPWFVPPLAFLALEMSSSFLSVASLQGPSLSTPLLHVL